MKVSDFTSGVLDGKISHNSLAESKFEITGRRHKFANEHMRKFD